MEGKIWWADEIDEPEFRDNSIGRLPDPVKVRAAREEELKELERRACVEAGWKEWNRVTGKKFIGVRWVDVDEGCRLVAKGLQAKVEST